MRKHKKRIAVAVAWASSALTGVVHAATGNDLISWVPAYERDVTNWESGMFLGFVSGISNVANGIAFCAPTSTNGQSAAIVAKFLKNNPERWGEDAAALTLEALRKGYPKCKDTPT
ncbi:Rap1a/Tai family immunity protein [Pseudomonas sichuanensis]|uniref:Rap1a/Tai family immunity protein n=1 Tax=Pseudomonas sichuanensis TaxID=2213015 RepID=UPI000DA66136|nr:Rap1a/Tai family immunity protein [Pseudomonas sichuanensis]